MNQKKIAGENAAEYTKDGMVVGLGTGSTARYMVDKVGEMVKNGLTIQGVPTSKATEYIKDGMVVGLGTGPTARYMVDKVGEMVKNGLKIQGVPTSKATEEQARSLGIPLLDINDVDHIDLDIDGVDEIDGDFNAT